MKLRVLLRLGVATSLLTAGAAVVAPAADAASLSASLVSTRTTSTWTVPSPDPAGITYRPDIDRLVITDSEVDEMSIYRGVNVFVSSLQGSLDTTGNGTTLPWSKEPTGAGFRPNDKHLFVSDDDANRIYEVTPGNDNRHGTSDDTVTSFSTQASGNSDAEGVDVDTTNDGHVLVIDGSGNDVYDYFWGSNRRFDGVPPAGDDTVSRFDVGIHGATDPEGIEFFPERNTIFVLEHKTKTIYELSRTGTLLNKINITSARAVNPAGLTIAPASDGSGRQNFYIVDRGLDNDSNPTENDGKFYEMSADLPPLGGANVAPTVSAGPDASVTLPASASLDGTVTDDGLPNPPQTVTTTWSTVSGPGTVTFANASAVDTTATFSAAGTYELRLTASDSALSSSDSVLVTVASSGGGGGGGTPGTLDIAISPGAGDAEQLGSTVGLTSSDLSLGTDAGRAQTVGLRFAGVQVPRNAVITKAYVQFQVDESNTAAASLTFRGEASDNAALFTTASNNITSRPSTAATATWNAPTWPTVGARGADQQSADLSAVVREIVSRSGWTPGNALALVVSGTGERTARSLEGKPAPVLHLEFTS